MTGIFVILRYTTCTTHNNEAFSVSGSRRLREFAFSPQSSFDGMVVNSKVALKGHVEQCSHDSNAKAPN